MNTNGAHDLDKLVRSLQTLRCWYVSCGGASASTFQLALGEKVRRLRPLKNTSHPDEYRQFEGAANLLVWCSWRLDGTDSPLTSSDDVPTAMESGLKNLVGATIDSISLAAPAWDLALRFSNGLQLLVFCDHVPGEPSFDGNWELWLKDVAASVGPGSQWTLETRTDGSAQADPSVAGQAH